MILLFMFCSITNQAMLKNMTIKEYTTFKIGGLARYFSACNSIEDFHDAVTWCKDRDLPWFILGNGSNILVSDDGFPGLVIKLCGDFKKVVFNENTVEAGAGVLLPVLSRLFLAKEWGGFEFMCGIPGTIGGAVRINAGTKQGEIKDNFISAMILTPGGEIRSVPKQEMEFAYRHSCLASTRDIILSASFSPPCFTDRDSIREKIKEIIASRRQKQPQNKRNCGSVFKSFPGQKPASWHLEKIGMKGMMIGDAMVANEHANWIVNIGRARSEDVKKLIKIGQKRVFAEYGIQLEREVIYLPEDMEHWK